LMNIRHQGITISGAADAELNSILVCKLWRLYCCVKRLYCRDTKGDENYSFNQVQSTFGCLFDGCEQQLHKTNGWPLGQII
jgi:hypothetical protein